jgi:hypothetical protein
MFVEEWEAVSIRVARVVVETDAHLAGSYPTTILRVSPAFALHRHSLSWSRASGVTHFCSQDEQFAVFATTSTALIHVANGLKQLYQWKGASLGRMRSNAFITPKRAGGGMSSSGFRWPPRI